METVKVSVNTSDAATKNGAIVIRLSLIDVLGKSAG